MYDSERDERGFWRRQPSWLRARLIRLRIRLIRLRIRLARLISRRLR